MTEAVKRRREHSGPGTGGAYSRDGPGAEVPSAADAPQSAGDLQGLPGAPGALAGVGERQRLGEGGAASLALRPERQDDLWSMTLRSMRTSFGETVELLTIVDGYTRECLSIMVEGRVTLENIVDRLFDLFVLREVPRRIAVSGDSRSLSDALAEWLKSLPVETEVWGPEGCWEDGGAGSFDARLRDEMLAGQALATLADARDAAARWRRQYNETRPQRSPLEDEPQAPEGGEDSGCPEADPSAGQTLPPAEEPLTAAAPSEAVAEKDWAPPGWDARMPKWTVYAARAVELVGIILVFFVLTLVVLMLLAPHFGWRADTVLSGSMEPALPAGCVQVTRPVALEEIIEGDIITFRSPTDGGLMSHRVVEVESGEAYQFRTKGDANEDVDPYLIPGENVVGRVCFTVPHVGRVAEYLKSPLGFILLGLIGFALIAAEISTMLEVRWREAAGADSKSKQQ